MNLRARSLSLWIASTAVVPLAAQSTTVVGVDSDRLAPNGVAYAVNVSADGRWVTWSSPASNLVADDTNGKNDVFVRDRSNATTELVSRSSAGVIGNGGSHVGSISDDGRFVAFQSDAGNLVAGDTNSDPDIFVRDRSLGTTELVSRSSAGVIGNASSALPSISGDGRHVVFTSDATNLVAQGGSALGEIFAHDLDAATTELVSINLGGGVSGDVYHHDLNRHVSADGRFVVFTSSAFGLVAGDAGMIDVFVRDRATGVTEVASIAIAGPWSNGNSFDAAISRDGRFVTFRSDASNLAVGDLNADQDVFVRDRQLGTTEIVSIDSDGSQGTGSGAIEPYGESSISDDGRFVAFLTGTSNLLEVDSNGQLPDVVLRDRTLNTTQYANVNQAGMQATGAALSVAITGDGSRILWAGSALNLVNGLIGHQHAYLRDRSVTAPHATYCTAKVNSAGCTPTISTSGLPSIGGFDDFHVTAEYVLGDKVGLFFWNTMATGLPFGGGTLCVKPPSVRTPLQSSGSAGAVVACPGRYSYHFTHAYVAQKSIAPGTALYGQYWSRDNGFAPPNNVGLTDAVTFTVVP